MDADGERLLIAGVQVLVAGLAWTYARQRPEHRIVALLFAWQVAANLARLAIDPVLDVAVPPYRGTTLVLYYLDHVLVLSFRFAFVAAFWVHFAGGRARSVAPALAAAIVAVIAYKEATHASLEPVHRAISWLAIGACVAITVYAMLAPARRLRTPDGAHAVLMLLAATDVVNAALTYLRPFDESWSEIRVNASVVDGLVAAGYGAALAREAIVSWRTTSHS